MNFGFSSAMSRKSARPGFRRDFGGRAFLVCDARACERAPPALLALPDQKADVGVARVGGGLESALDDERGDAAVDLQDDGAGERLVGVELLPQVALGFERLKQVIDARESTSGDDGFRVPGRA